MHDVTEELIKTYLDNNGYIVLTNIENPIPTQAGNRASDFDIFAIKLKRSNIDEIIIGEVKGFWTENSFFSPSVIKYYLEGKEDKLSRTFNDDNIRKICEHYGIDRDHIKIRKILYYSLRGRKKHEEAMKIMENKGIEVEFIEDKIFSEVKEKINLSNGYPNSLLLQTLRIDKALNRLSAQKER